MISNTSWNNLFKDYYFNKKGTFLKSFEIKIGNFHSGYDIYWGDPIAIFEKKTLKESFPLAVTVIPHRNIVQNPRIFLHEKIEAKYKKSFEMIVAHEIGHIWLHDVVGFNHPMTGNFITEYKSEIWADYFAYSFFVRYRNIICLEKFNKIIEEVINLQIQIYNLDPKQHLEYVDNKRIENLKVLDDNVKMEIKNRKPKMIQMINAIEITLNSLGDVFQ